MTRRVTERHGGRSLQRVIGVVANLNRLTWGTNWLIAERHGGRSLQRWCRGRSLQRGAGDETAEVGVALDEG